MCLSCIYTDEKTDENCIMEEAALVEKKGNTVEISNLFGEEKHVRGYSVSTVDLMKNYVLLKKEDKPEQHSHSHDHEDKDSVAGRLRILLPHLLDHNSGHIEDIEKWAHKAEHAGYSEAAEEMKEIIKLYKEADEHFERAIQKLGQ
jgi:predicted RNA-binding protein